MCLTNEEMRKELVKNALEWIKQEPDAGIISISQNDWLGAVSYTHLRAHETVLDLVCRLLLEKKKIRNKKQNEKNKTTSQNNYETHEHNH